MKTGKDVIEWLKQEGLLNVFFIRVSQDIHPISLSSAKMLIDTSDDKLFSRSFRWRGTPEGAPYWCDIQERYFHWLHGI